MQPDNTDPIAILQDLIRCPSVTPLDEGAQQVIVDILEPLGFTCHRLKFGEIENLFARIGTDGPHFCYAGHTDVVPPGDESAWTHPPFGAVIDDGFLYGRGVADMKGGNACFIAAAVQYIEKYGRPPGSLSFLITGDEEGPAIDGTVRVLEWMEKNGHVPDVSLVGEPSNPAALGEEIKIGRRGSLSGVITVKGKQGHVAYQDLADNPLPRLITLLDALACHEFDKGTDHFTATNLEITTIDVGNTASNVIPAQGTAVFNVRFNDNWNAATLEAKIREILDGTGAAYFLDTECNAESFVTAPGPFTDLVADAVEATAGRRPELTTFGGTSDARFITNYCPVVEFGLVNDTIHQIDERAAVADIEKLTAIYLKILERYFQP